MNRPLNGKKCSKCSAFKTLDLYVKDKNKKDGLTHWCAQCMRESNRKSYLKNKEKYRVRAKIWNELNKEEYARKKREKRDLDPRQDLIYSAKHRAKQRGFDFNLTKEDITIPEVCPVLGINISRRNTSQSRSSPSIDRIDSTKGYTVDNVQVISWQANTMKTNATKEELLAFADWVYRMYKETND